MSARLEYTSKHRQFRQMVSDFVPQTVDARIQTIYGGTTEIMKTIVAKDLGI